MTVFITFYFSELTDKWKMLNDSEAKWACRLKKKKPWSQVNWMNCASTSGRLSDAKTKIWAIISAKVHILAPWRIIKMWNYSILTVELNLFWFSLLMHHISNVKTWKDFTGMYETNQLMHVLLHTCALSVYTDNSNQINFKWIIAECRSPLYKYEFIEII